MCDPPLMDPINGRKHTLVLNDPKETGKGNDTPAPIAAHAAFVTVGIKIHHLEVQTFVLGIFQKNKPVGPYAKFSVAKLTDQFGIVFGQEPCTIVDHNKIVSGPLIFVKSKMHC